MSMQITDLLAFGVKNKASDLHISPACPPMIRVNGDIRRINLPEMNAEEVGNMIASVMNDLQRKKLPAKSGNRLLLRAAQRCPLPCERL